jgi:hypothetical protein
MNHLHNEISRMALIQFIMETESNEHGSWSLDPEHSKMDKMFVIKGPQERAWFIRCNQNHMQMYVAPHIYLWAGGITISHICINHAAASIDINFGIVNDGEISTFGLRFPCIEYSLDKLNGSETLQFALAPDNFEGEFNEEITSGINIPVKHLEGIR